MYLTIAEITSYFRQQYKADLELFDKGPNQGGHTGGEYSYTTHNFETQSQKDAEILNLPVERRTIFCVFLALEVMLDEVFYTYDKDYQMFRHMHPLPKLDFCGHGLVDRNPWSPFSYIKKPSLETVRIASAVFLNDVISGLNDEQLKLFRAVLKNDRHFVHGFNATAATILLGIETIRMPAT